MFKYIAVFILSISLVTGCTMSYTERERSISYKVTKVFPPVYYGTEDYPVSSLYVILENNITGELTERLFVDQRCESQYKKVNIGNNYNLITKEWSTLGISDSEITNLKHVLCDS